VVPLLVLAGCYYVSHHTFLTGTLPAFHLGIPHGFNLADAPAVKGKVFLVTGANKGLGFETCVGLAKKQATVVMGCRTAKACHEAKNKLERIVPGDNYKVKVVGDLDLSTLANVRAFVTQYKKSGLGLDVLVLNAGIMHVPHSLSEDGIEMHMAVNHFAHAALTFGLLDLLLKSESPRVVVLSSVAQHSTVSDGIKLSLKDINDPTSYDSRQHSYGHSKLANLFFAKSLQKYMDTKMPAGKKAYVTAVHPGGVVSDLMRHTVGTSDAAKKISGLVYWSTEDGALTQLACAIDPRIEKENLGGQYFVPIARNVDAASSPFARDEKLIQKFWDFTVKTLKEKGCQEYFN